MTASPEASALLAVALEGRSTILQVGEIGAEALAAATARGAELDLIAAEESGLRPRRSFVADLNFDDPVAVLGTAMYDAVVVGDILERLHAPWSFLERLRSVLREGGVLIAIIHNSEHGALLIRERYGELEYEAYGILEGNRLRFFTRALLQELMLRGGFAIDRLEATTADLFSGRYGLPVNERSAISDEEVASIASDPDSETYEFVVTASALDDASHAARLGHAYADALARLEAARTVGERLEAAQRDAATAKAELSDAVSRFTRSELDAAARAAEIARSEADAARARADREETFLALEAASERLASAEQTSASLERHALRLTQALGIARARTRAAEHELLIRVMPLADGAGSIEGSDERLSDLQRRAALSTLLIDQLNALNHARTRPPEMNAPRPGRRLERLRRLARRFTSLESLRKLRN